MDETPPDDNPAPEKIGPAVGSSGYMRLFLDDDPARADAFLDKFPDAHWVETAADCIQALADNTWDEIHLDHDLEGEWFVDSERDDCGMEVVRWLTTQPRNHLLAAKFVVHTHNQNAAMVMVTQLGLAGYYVLEQPFGSAPAEKAGASVDIFQPPSIQPAKTQKRHDEPLKAEVAEKPSLLRRVLRWFVPPPSVDTPWTNAPGGMKSGHGSKQGWGMPGAPDIFNPEIQDDDSAGPYVLPIREEDLDENGPPQRRRRDRGRDRRSRDDDNF